MVYVLASGMVPSAIMSRVEVRALAHYTRDPYYMSVASEASCPDIVSRAFKFRPLVETETNSYHVISVGECETSQLRLRAISPSRSCFHDVLRRTFIPSTTGSRGPRDVQKRPLITHLPGNINHRGKLNMLSTRKYTHLHSVVEK